MNNPNNDDQDLSGLLNEAYEKPAPDKKFADALLVDVQKRFDAGTSATKTSFWKKSLPIAAAACVGGIAMFVFLKTREPAIPPVAVVQQENAKAPSATEKGERAIDPWYADNRPEIVACREAWRLADAEYIKTQSPPQSVTSEQQRQIAIDAIERAVAMIPDAPPVPLGLGRIAQMWTTRQLGEEQPEKAIAIFDRIIAGFPNTYWELNALEGKAMTYSTFRDYPAAEKAWRKAMDWKLPDTAPDSLRRTYERVQEEGVLYIADAREMQEFILKKSMLAQGGVDRSRPSGMALGLLGDIDSIGRAPLILRAKVLGWKEEKVQLEITRVIYGDYSEKTVDLDQSGILNAFKTQTQPKLASELNRQPTDAEITERTLKDRGIEKGKDLIVHLKPFKQKSGAIIYQQMSMHFQAPPKFPLDDYEDKVVKIIASGEHLSPNFPQPGDVLMEHIRDASLIVKAQLQSVNDKESSWSVIAPVKGDITQKTITIPHDLFKLRAEAVARHAQGTTRPAVIVQDEMSRMIKQELIVGRTAVLFLSDEKPDGQTLHAQLNKRIYEDETGAKLDRAIEAINAAAGGNLPMHL